MNHDNEEVFRKLIDLKEPNRSILISSLKDLDQLHRSNPKEARFVVKNIRERILEIKNQ